MRGQRFSSPEDTIGEFKRPCFGAVLIGVEKQTQMTAVHQNILSTVLLKHVKLSYGNGKFHLETQVGSEKIGDKQHQSRICILIDCYL